MKLPTVLTVLVAGLATTSHPLPEPLAKSATSSSGMTPPDALNIRQASTGAPAGRQALPGAVSAGAPAAPAVVDAPNPKCVPGWEHDLATGAAIASPFAGMAGSLLGIAAGAKFDRWISSPGHVGEALFGAVGAACGVAPVAFLSTRSLVDAKRHGICQPDCTTDAGGRAASAFLWGGQLVTSAGGMLLGVLSGASLVTRSPSTRVTGLAVIGGAVTGGALGLAAPMVPAIQRAIKASIPCEA